MRPPELDTLPRGGVEPLLSLRAGYHELLADARRRTLALVEAVAEEDLNRVHDPLMSPLVWDLGHIAAFEDLWLCRSAGLEPLRPDLADTYDAAETPRRRRGELAYLRLPEVLAFMTAVRERALGVLELADFSDPDDELNRDGFVWDMLVQHEQQHNETMLQTLKLAASGTYAPERRPAPGPPPANGPLDEMVDVEAGSFPMGADGHGFAYDNERPQHELHLDGFAIDRLPVTNGAFLEFVEAGGYRRRDWWCDAGWAWRERERVERPLYWSADGHERSFELVEPLDPALPVMYVSWYEADAFARSRGKRLPSEAEWEKAASWDAAAGVKRRYPWGDEPPSAAHANLDQLGFGPAPAGAYPAGAAPCGALGMLGDAWEWTATDLGPYPGFRAFPYRDYSEAFFGGPYKMLRGVSWATRPRVARTTFRNWDYPQRRQIHAGFRCARDA